MDSDKLLVLREFDAVEVELLMDDGAGEEIAARLPSWRKSLVVESGKVRI